MFGNILFFIVASLSAAVRRRFLEVTEHHINLRIGTFLAQSPNRNGGWKSRDGSHSAENVENPEDVVGGQEHDE